MPKKLSYPYRQLLLRYQKVGRGKPLLLLHGWGSSGDVMVPLAQSLAGLRSCYIFDLPGFGDTDAPPIPWAVDDYAAMISSFIKNTFDEPVDLLGHSFGGRISLKLCAQTTGENVIDKVLITGGAGMKPRRSFSFYLKKYTARILKFPFMLLPAPARERSLATLRRTSFWKALGSSDYRKLNGVMRETFVKTVNDYLEPILPDIGHEVLLLWGAGDEATPLYQAKRMEQGIKNAALVKIEHAGHYAFLDRPNHFIKIARAFFEG